MRRLHSIKQQGRGGGIYTSSTFIVGNSIVSRNSTDISGIINSQGYNLIGIDPLLNVLSDNGGQTQTHSLHPNSPAIEQGNGTIAGVANDQRGLIRPVDNPAIPNAPGGDGADIGASEREPFVVSVSGRVATPGGRGISGAFLTLTDATGVSRIHPTNPFGYFHFPGVRTGEVSTISVFSKRHRFNPSSRQIAFFANTANTNFVSEN